MQVQGALSPGMVFNRPGLGRPRHGEEPPASSAGGVGVEDWNRWYEMYNEEAKRAAEEQRRWSAAQAKEQMEFQERMANTAYQRAVQDMKAAGLNPALLYGHGSGGASSPAGAMATSASREVYEQNDPLKLLTSLLTLLGSVVNSASSVFRIFR